MAIKVLLVEDDRALREALADTLLLAGHDYKAVARAHQGELRLRSRLGRGTCAQVTLPLFSSAQGAE